MFTVEKAQAAQQANAARAAASCWKPLWHISAPSGWINDPNGFIFYKGQYHLFYQHHPYSPNWDTMHWGHVVSDDLAHWRHLPVALAPDTDYEGMCYSGSAVEQGGDMVLLYTGHRMKEADMEVQCLAKSRDGLHFEKPIDHPVIGHAPEGFASDFRDPYVFRCQGRWFMVLGCNREGDGCALLYESDDLTAWRERGVLYESNGRYGSMWECPNLVRVDKKYVLIFSPMRMPGHKNIALVGDFDPEAGRFIPDPAYGDFFDLDLGPDYYAALTTRVGARTLSFAWLNGWGRPTPAPTAEHGWQGLLGLPRELHIRDGRLLQFPAEELKALRGESIEWKDVCDNSYELSLAGDCFSLSLTDGGETLFKVSEADGKVTFEGEGTVCTVPCEGELRLFVDRCSVECFTADGAYSFTARIHPRETMKIHLEGDCREVRCWPMEKAFQ